ncbi:MAG TPA: FlgD immunoglobulin-like domain containing protein [bacterium]|nr:FlgD immunoglobulin-like domain containing protein [bacterium]HPN43013.1 FlgD immunoglobulin-like domain containing protein [bacterium]
MSKNAMRFLFLFVLAIFIAPYQLLFADIIVIMTNPADETVFPVGQPITLTADIQLTSGTFRDVRFYYGTAIIGKGVGSLPTYSYTWENARSGNYDIFARVRDTDGNQVDSDPIHVRVGNVSRGDKIINGGFDLTAAPWSIQGNEGGAATLQRRMDMYFNDSAYAYIDITNGGTADWHVQLLQTFPILAEHTYEVYFMADSEEKKTITVAMQESHDDYSTYLWQSVEIDGAALYGPVMYDCLADDPTSQFKFCVGGNTIDIYFDEVQVIDRTLTSVSSHKLYPTTGSINTFELMNNYPNPFNMNTSIQYRLSKTADVVLDVYNIQGQLVKSLVNEKVNAGLYTANWDGTDNGNFVVPSGVYIFKMNIPAENVQLTRKVLLVK